MQNHLLLEVRDDLFEAWEEKKYAKMDIVRKMGRKTKHLMLIKEGACCIQMVLLFSFLLFLLIIFKLFLFYYYYYYYYFAIIN